MKRSSKVKVTNIAIAVGCLFVGILIRQLIIDPMTTPPPPGAELIVKDIVKNQEFYQGKVDLVLDEDPSQSRFYRGACLCGTREFNEKKFRKWVKKEIPAEYRVTLTPKQVELDYSGAEVVVYSGKVLRIN